MNHYLFIISIFLIFPLFLTAQISFNINDLKGTTWHQYEIQKRDTIPVFNREGECSVPVELIFHVKFDSSNFKIFRKNLLVISIGYYNIRICFINPITYLGMEDENSCPDYIFIHSRKNHIWYGVGESPHKKNTNSSPTKKIRKSY